jgi:hypothetical protein
MATRAANPNAKISASAIPTLCVRLLLDAGAPGISADGMSGPKGFIALASKKDGLSIECRI